MAARCLNVLEDWNRSCEKSDFCIRHKNNWTLMKEELASYMTTGTHFPHTEQEIDQFFAYSTVDAAILFFINAKNSRAKTWEMILKDPIKWVNDPIFSRMKESIKSIRRHYIFKTLPTTPTPKETLQILIGRLDGLEKAKECFKSNCLIPYRVSDPTKIEEIITEQS
jgi:hypothetical protein